MWGYGMEVGTHAVRIMASGVLDRFPKLKIVIGHMGEAVHFWLWRITFMNSRNQTVGRSPKTQLTMAEYFLRNFAITTSGMEDDLALEYSIKKLGEDNVMWAIDYPTSRPSRRCGGWTRPRCRTLSRQGLRRQRRTHLPHPAGGLV